MARKIVLLILLSVSLGIGGVWALKAQDPTPQTPTTPTPKTPTTPTPQTPATPRTEPQTTTMAPTTQVDLSGTYAGTFDCDAAGLTGDTTITINGNEFTTASGKTGRIIASKNRGYTAIALQVSGADATATPVIVSLRGKKTGSKLTLKAAPGQTMKCSFTPGRNVAKNRRTPRTPAATGTEVSNPAAMPAQTPAPSPTPTVEPSPTPTVEPSPEPNPSPTPSGSPRPRPRPTASPSPSPAEPMPSPTPSPSPSPRPFR